jgi:translation initiation factor 5A
MEVDEEIEVTASGASLTIPSQVGSLKKNGYVVLKDHPVRIVEMSVSKVGKHGSAKAKITGIDVFTGNKYEEIHPTSHNVDVPVIVREDWTCVDVTRDGFAVLMNDAGDTKEDLKVPEDETGAKIRDLLAAGGTVSATVLKAMGMEKIVDCKEI